ncbi:Putative Flp pilus-assembly TadE/G-like [Desulforamulus putei DSM 12395]|uniref:Putative Flp pilus-assembly TadE/G-like n=1 Tax=Desulforamulus putei DSM 12395 TaxID=1121429 RepID=A0A1M4ZGB0_9FIRM|nr:Putative Flp pilus-assembly TadE/G-like [Desulforamulus putei DSM 12395]
MVIKKILKDQKGGILPITAGVIFIFLALVAIVVDFGRYTAAKEKLQTAGDAAALAAAKSVDRYVKLEIDPGSSRECCDCKKGCCPCCVDCGDPIIVVGKEADLIDNEGWRRYCCSCGCNGDPEILDRWVDYKNGGDDAVIAANTVFEINKPAEMDAQTGGSSNISVDTSYLSQNRRNSRFYPSVFVQAHGKVRTLLMDFLKLINPNANFEYLNASTCSQGRTYYHDVNNGKWQRPPDNYCEE